MENIYEKKKDVGNFQAMIDSTSIYSHSISRIYFDENKTAIFM